MSLDIREVPYQIPLGGVNEGTCQFMMVRSVDRISEAC